MNIDTWAVVFATLLGPVAAVQAQKAIEKWQGAKQRKRHIFDTLMINRSAALSDAMVVSLNAVPLEYEKDNAKDERVLDKWRSYLIHLRTPSTTKDSWIAEEQRRLLDLVEAMANYLGLKFRRSDLEQGPYVPDYFWSRWNEQEDLRKGVLALLRGKPLIVENSGVSTPEGKMAAQLATEILAGKRPIHIVNEERRNEIDVSRTPGRRLDRGE
jgi:hypothetical protein